MKHTLMILRFTVLLTFISTFFTSKAQTAVYPDNGTLYDGALHKIELVFEADTLKALYDSANRWTDHYFPATFIYDDVDTMKNVGIRIKGNSSRNAHKQSLKVSIDEFDNQKYQKLKTFNLNGDHNDPSMLREFLSAYVMQKAGIPCLRANTIKLFINGTFSGMFTHTEQVNKKFIDSRFGDDNGNLYKCSWPADLGWIDNNPDTYKNIINPSPLNERAYELKTNEDEDDYTDFVQLLNVINNSTAGNFIADIEAIFDVQTYLKTLAAEVLIGHWDNYYYNKNNYHLYHNPVTNKFVYLPYDMDNTFGVQWGVSNINNRNIHQWGNNGVQAPLTKRILAITNYKKAYEGYIKQIIDTVFNEAHLFPLIDNWKQMVDADIKVDPYFTGLWTSDYGYTYTDWKNSFDMAIDGHATFGVKPYIADRKSSALSQFIFNATSVAELDKTGVRLYPNPVQNQLFVDVAEGNTQFELYNLAGTLLQAQQLSTGSTAINISTLAKGIYIVRTTNAGMVYNHKIVVQ